MKLFARNLIPRLKQYSASLDKKEIFIEIPWVIIDENQNQQKYIFKRDGELVMSFNGIVTLGKWEYISAAKCLLIDRIQDKILLNQDFIDPAIMILKKDGVKDENLILANEILLPDLDVEGYIKRLYYQANRIIVKRLKNGDLLELIHYDGNLLNNKVSIEGEDVLDGKLELDKEEANDYLDDGRSFLIKDSQIVKVFIENTYETENGKIIIETVNGNNPEIGDLVFYNNMPAPDQKYRLGFLHHIKVVNGSISKISSF